MKKIEILPGKENLFHEEIGKHPIFVKFYMDGCPHCENMKQDWTDMGNDLLKNYQGDLTVMSVNARTLNNLKSPLVKSVNGFPSIFIIKRDGLKGPDFEGERTKDDMLKFVLDNVKDIQKRETSMQMPTSSGNIMDINMSKMKRRRRKSRGSGKSKNTKRKSRKSKKSRKSRK